MGGGVIMTLVVEKKSVQRVWLGKLKERELRKCENNVKMDLKEVER